MINDEKILVRDELLKLLRNGKLSKTQKTEILNLIEQDDDATDNERERFSLYYGLNVNEKEPLNFKQIAQLYGCSESSIRTSVYNMKRKMLKYTDLEENEIVKRIIKESKERKTGWREN